MEHHQKTMAFKWARHYRETKTTISMGLMLLGTCFIVSLVVLWPQKLTVDVFNSRLLYHTIIDIEDYFTCSRDYQEFVIDEPTSEDRLTTMYVFNITNVADTIEQGYKPTVTEVGPFAYLRHTYKYDIAFDTVDSLNVTFKEYTILKPVEDPYACQRMYFRLDRGADATFNDPCGDGACLCKSHDEVLTTINPLYLKYFWAETPQLMISHYAQPVFQKVLEYMENGFIAAARAHLVYEAFNEIVLFRQQAQVGRILNTIFSHLYANYTIAEVGQRIYNQDASFPLLQNRLCGLQKFGLTSCPLTFGERFKVLTQQIIADNKLNATLFVLPSNYDLFLDPASKLSFLNSEYGLPMWVGVCHVLGLVDFLGNQGYIMATRDELAAGYNNFVYMLAAHNANTTVDQVTQLQYLEASVVIQGFAFYLSYYYINGQPSLMVNLAYEEFNSVSQAVPCSPLGVKCVWQWGYMRKFHSAHYSLPNSVIFTFVDFSSKLTTNLNNVMFAANSARLYNVYAFCSRYGSSRQHNASDELCPATDMSYTFRDALTIQPASFLGAFQGVNAVNTSRLFLNYNSLPEDMKDQYFRMSCNMSTLLHEAYREQTDYHDQYVIRYINLHKDPNFNHTFLVGHWKDFAYAQWGAGIITDALVGVRGIIQVMRDGMWVFGTPQYNINYYEYSTWAIRSGFPNAYIYDIHEAKALLYTLADDTDVGVEYRRNLAYRATTFIGDGVNIINDVGYVGDYCFVTEAYSGNFHCDGAAAQSCGTASTVVTSSSLECLLVESYYDSCVTATTNGNPWVTNCQTFQTSMSAYVGGIPCDLKQVFGHFHPFDKLIGNIIYQMVLSMTVELYVKVGLWCTQSAGCNYEFGGLYLTVPARRIFFEGLSDPSMLSFLNLKYKRNSIHFLCRENAYDHCGNELLRCNDRGIVMSLPHKKQKILTYGETPNDEFFAPQLYVVLSTGELIWPYSMNATTLAHAQKLLAKNRQQQKQNPKFNNILIIPNPHWTSYPAWNTDDVAFNKFIQCQKRMYSGEPDLFANCFDTLNTGRLSYNESLQILMYHGNATIRQYPEKDTLVDLVVNGSTDERHYYGTNLWDGFLSYPYPFNFKLAGPKFYTKSSTILFDKLHAMRMKLSQSELLYQFQRDIPTEIPYPEIFKGVEPQTNHSLHYLTVSPKRIATTLRRFTETKESWTEQQILGTPRDSYGMPYKVPLGFASLQTLTSVPLFLGTAHDWGNKFWGGLEWNHVNGYTPDRTSDQTYVDYDPVMGIAIRQALRQQVHLRVERSPLHPNLISSQQRCLAPTKSFSGGLGYGCYSYIPIMWLEDSRVINPEVYFRYYDHYYSRPNRALTLSIMGLAIGIVLFLSGVCLFLSEAYHRRKFKMRVYVD